MSWRWIFYINLPFIGIGIPMVWFFLRLKFRPSSFWAKLQRVDWIGTFLFVGSLTSFLIPVTWVCCVSPPPFSRVCTVSTN